MKTIKEAREIKLIMAKKGREFLKKGERLVVRDIKGNVITLVKPEQKEATMDNIQAYQGIWKEEKDVNEVFNDINKKWRKWKSVK